MADATTTLSDDDRNKLLAALTESLAMNSGRGSKEYITETVLSRHDRFGSSPIQINSEMVGLTFFTKPRLNLTTTSLRQDRHLSMLDTLDPSSLMFALRCNLDTEFMRSKPGHDPAIASPWVNELSPFNIPLGNTIVGMSGWPDFNLEYETTEAGYFAEDMTLARGSDRGRRTYDISCTFRDIQGGYVMAYFFYWLHAMALQMEGAIVAYPEDREANRLNYTCSIYRFIMDPSMRHIVKWAKGTGCYPVSIPIGDVFNYGPGDSFIHTSQQFTIPFKVNNVTYMDPIHLQAFNTLVNRYNPAIPIRGNEAVGLVEADTKAAHNFAGTPVIELYNDANGSQNRLKWFAKKTDLVDPGDAVIKQIQESIAKNITSPLQERLISTPTSTLNTPKTT